MNWRSGRTLNLALVGILVLGSAALFQSTVLPAISLPLVSMGVRPSLVLLLVVSWSIVRGGMDGAVWGFIGGLMIDLLSGGPLGASTLALTLVGLFTGMAEVNLSRHNQIFPTTITFGASLVYDLICMAMWSLAGWRFAFADTFLAIVLPTAILNVLLSFVTLPLMSLLNRLVGGGRQLEW
ncbi:MAG: rod shape-determining protein MreD [Chloroflexi bacterium]|nr:rod shape-determining protein MreD [Chloroflexota bacterium]MBU1747892.1 rod shape-determining protein MreD [Chloroflexota bacterium]MBU1879851.1 rod shape-determining protein MreD [Chloroflexota bacterium]